VHLRYGSAVRIDAGDFPGLMLMQSCLDGKGTVVQGKITVECRPGQTVPLSPDRSTHLEFDTRFSQRSVRLDIERVEALCSKVINRPTDRPLQFVLQPFAPLLEKAWAEAVRLVLTYEEMSVGLPAAAAASLDEFLLSLLLTKHPHNYTDEMHDRHRAAPPRLIREAEHLMRNGDPTLTVSAIASQLRVSLRSLEAGFQECRHMTPTQRLRSIRLEKVR
jgi:hypothetical protein